MGTRINKSRTVEADLVHNDDFSTAMMPPMELEETALVTETSMDDVDMKTETEIRTGVIVGALRVRVRKDPSLDGEILKLLMSGDHIRIIGESGDYYQTAIGYVHKDYVKED